MHGVTKKGSIYMTHNYWKLDHVKGHLISRAYDLRSIRLKIKAIYALLAD